MSNFRHFISKPFFRRMITLLFVAPLFMATQCYEDDLQPTVFQNAYKVKFSNFENALVGDTIWINARVSINAFDSQLNDSISDSYYSGLDISLHKLQLGPNNTNAVDAIDKFEIINSSELYFSSRCSNGEFYVDPFYDDINNLYRLRIGLIPNTAGEYLLNLSGFSNEPVIENSDRNLILITNYPVEPEISVRLDNCGNILTFSNNPNTFFCFKVS